MLVYDSTADKLLMGFRSDWRGWAEEDQEILQALEDDLQKKFDEMGVRAVVEYMEDTLSNAILISERHELASDADFQREFKELYARLLEPDTMSH